MSNGENNANHPSAASAVKARLGWDRGLAVLLILLQLLVLGTLSGARGFPIVMGGMAVWGLVTRTRMRIDATPLSLIYSMVFIGYLLQYFLSPFELPLDSEFINSSLAHAIARFLISVQILQLFLHHDGGRLPAWLGGCGAVTMTFAANLRAPLVVHYQLLIVFAAFVGLFALYGGRARRPVPTPARERSVRWLALSSALLVTMLLGSGASWALQRHEREIEWFLTDYLGYGGRSARAGFSPQGRLHSVTSWKTEQADRVMLRVFADEAPGYLRGKAFDTYQGASRETSYTAWVSVSGRQPIPSVQVGRNLPRLRPGDQLFELMPTHAAPERVLDIWPAEESQARIFTSLGTSLLAINGNDARMDVHGIVTLDDRIIPVPYMVFETDSSARGGGNLKSQGGRELLTTLGSPVEPQVLELAEDVFAGCRTTREKLDAVQTFFHSNFEYRRAMNVPHGWDPMTYFLTLRPPAHCEYFATGTAVLLRLADVPCRYVVGYVAQEWNSVGGFWVARNKDAHAWVEAFDEESGDWVIVESTPGSGVPQPREPSLSSQLADSLRHRLSIWRMTIREYGLATLWMSLVQFVWSIPGLVVLLGALGVALARYRPQWIVRRRREQTPAYLKGMHHTLARLDRLTRQQGFDRSPSETLTQFARRLRESSPHAEWRDATARCYALYVDLRYRGKTGPDAVEQLQEATTRIPTTVPP